MDQWHESARFVHKATASSADNTLDHVVYDPYKELVWVAGSTGVVSSYFGPAIQPYTSFTVGAPVLDLQVSDKFVFTLTNNGVTTHRRTGQIRSKHPAQGQFMLIFESDLLIATPRRIYRHNIDTMQETGTFSIETPEPSTQILFLKRCAPYGVVLGLSNGTAQLVDPHTFEVHFTVRCHSGPLTDLDSKKSVIMTCGMSSRRYGVVNDQIVYVWDVRTRKPLPPLNLVDGAEFVRIHPRSATNCMVISKSDQLHIMDVKNPSNINIRQIVTTSKITGMDVSPQGDALAIIEANGAIHYWCREVPTAADFTPKNLELPAIEKTDVVIGPDTPLSSIGMPYYNQELLSYWSDEIVFNVGMPPCKDLTALRGNVAVKYESIHQKTRRSSVAVPKFLSERERLGLTDDDDENPFANDNSLELGKVPRAYRKQEIIFSKFGVQDFDFKFYNKSEYSGLENEQQGSNCINSLLQLLRWCPPVHNSSLETLAQHADEELPVLGELAILFDMLHKAKGRQSRASNFLNFLSSQPEVLAFGLLEPATPTSNLVNSLFKYVVKSLYQEEKPHTSAIHDSLAITVTSRIYGSCGFRADKVETADSLDALAVDYKGINTALSWTADSWSWCEKCDKKHSMAMFRQVSQISKVLFVNVLSHSNASGVASHLSFKQRVDKRTIKCVETEDPEYALGGYICQITHEGSTHAISVIKVDEQWYMFNDFLVTTIPEAEALDFSQAWKQPLLLMYLRKDASNSPFDYSGWKSKLNTSLLYSRNIVSGNLDSQSSATLLTKGELKKGDLVALDAEFVLLGQEISEIHSDGSKRLLKPQRMSLARVSVVRGTKDMTPFIDDFIAIDEPVVNYLTLYSGIEPGDLDPKRSPYGLINQQAATRRLWLLLNMGVVFVGHALVNDFRTINLQVPPEQVLDTAELFYDKMLNGSRRMSLKFLVWALFDDEIQTGNHDSIEDAQSALRLYYKCKELQENNELESALRDVYSKGQRTGFKVPTSAAQLETPK